MKKSFTSFIIVAAAIFMLVVPTIQAADIELTDSCSMADAITAANTDAAVGGCPAGNGADTILLTADIPLRAELPWIKSAIDINGNGFRISGATQYRVFNIGYDGELVIDDLTMLDGRADDCRRLDSDGNQIIASSTSCGGAILNYGLVKIIDSSIIDNSVDGKGGGIYNSGVGKLFISGSKISRNTADDQGGAVYNEGQGTITESSFDSNTSEWGGGAIFNSGKGALNVSDSRFVRNSAKYTGGAIYLWKQSNVYVSGSRFYRNEAGVHGGGAISVYKSEIVIANSSLTHNNSEEGGGISVDGSEATLTHVTIAYNTGVKGSGLYVVSDSNSTVRLRNSIIANNKGSYDCAGTIDTNVANITGNGCTRLPKVDPMLLDPLQQERVSPPDILLLADSPAVDAADALFCPDTDVVGTTRPQGADCDIGAFEFVNPNASE